MRFYIKNKNPKFSEDRTLKKFAWFPTKINDGLIIWLETYYVVEIYKNVCINMTENEYAMRWVEHSRYIKF